MSELHRIGTGGGTPQADVIFIHGLDGHPFKTWQHDPDRQTDCWLHWLADDGATIAVHTLEYAARSTHWLGQAMPLLDRAKEVLNEFACRGVGDRPLVLVCHSLGGLLAKQLLRTASDDAALPAWRKVADQTKGVAFLATPHAGADLARTLRRIGWALRTSPAIEDLRAHAPALRELNEWYRGFAVRRAVRTLCYYETYRTAATRWRWMPLVIKVVEDADADPGLGAAVRPMPLDADHISIAKPAKRDHQLCAAVLELVHEIAPPTPPDDKLAPVDPLQMRADLGDFQDRGDKQDKVLAALRGGGQAAISAIDGKGGIGKTALAVHLAHALEAAGETPDGQRFLDLQGMSETPLPPLEAMARIVQSFDETVPRPASQNAAAIAYRHILNGKRVLLVLDNARDDAQVAPLLRHRALTTRIIVTSRRTITAQGIDAIALDEMSPDQAVSFLRGIVGEGRDTNPEIERLVRRCGRLPLALRVAGRFLKGHPGLTIADYIESIDQAAVDFAIPGEPDTDVRAVLGLSARALAREDRALAERWQMLAVCPDDFDRDAAAAVWKMGRTTASLQLGELAARSMVNHDEATRRWRLHDLMRDVAALPLDGQDGAALDARLQTARALHARHYCGVLAAANALYLRGGEAVLAGLSLYALEQPNVAAGHAWTVARMDADDAAARLASDYANAGFKVLPLRLHPREQIDWLEAQRSACVRLNDRASEGSALGNLGSAWATLGEPRVAIGFHEQALKVSREIGDRRAEGHDLGSLGNAWRALGEPGRAAEFYVQSLAIAREVGDWLNEGGTLVNLGVAWADVGEPRRAIELYDQALAIAREIGDLMGEGNALLNWGVALDALGERDEAVRRVREALAIYEAIGAKDRVGRACALLAEWGAADERS